MGPYLNNVACLQWDRYCAACVNFIGDSTSPRPAVPCRYGIHEKHNTRPIAMYPHINTELINSIKWGCVASCDCIVVVAVVKSYPIPKDNA